MESVFYYVCFENSITILENDVRARLRLNCTTGECLFKPDNGTLPDRSKSHWNFIDSHIGDPVKPIPRTYETELIIGSTALGIMALCSIGILIWYFITRMINVKIYTNWKRYFLVNVRLIDIIDWMRFLVFGFHLKISHILWLTSKKSIRFWKVSLQQYLQVLY